MSSRGPRPLSFGRSQRWRFLREKPSTSLMASDGREKKKRKRQKNDLDADRIFLSFFFVPSLSLTSRLPLLSARQTKKKKRAKKLLLAK